LKTAPAILLFLLSAVLSGQTDTGGQSYDTLPGNYYHLYTVERDGVSLPEIEIKEVFVVGHPGKSKKFPFNKYQRLIYNLKKVYPYALVVRSKFDEVNHELEKIQGDSERKKYLRNIEKQVFGEYEDDARSMTITQGRLLIKLIDRETQNTSYELIKQYRGSFSASFWQFIARIFGTDLKAEYDPMGEDFLIELILIEIEAGRL